MAEEVAESVKAAAVDSLVITIDERTSAPPRPRGRPRKPAKPKLPISGSLAMVDAAGNKHADVKVSFTKDCFDEEGGFVVLFLKVVAVYRRHRLSGDCRLVFDWMLENIAYKRGNVVFDATCARIAAEAVAPATISIPRVSVLLNELQSAGLILRGAHRSGRSTVLLNPHYVVLGNAEMQRNVAKEWDEKVAEREHGRMLAAGVVKIA